MMYRIRWNELTGEEESGDPEVRNELRTKVCNSQGQEL